MFTTGFGLNYTGISLEGDTVPKDVLTWSGSGGLENLTRFKDSQKIKRTRKSKF